MNQLNLFDAPKPEQPILKSVSFPISITEESLNTKAKGSISFFIPIEYADGVKPRIELAQDVNKLLKTLMGRVYVFMKNGQWRILHDIAKATGGSEAGVSARLRDFRKARFAHYNVQAVEVRKVKAGGALREYRLVL